MLALGISVQRIESRLHAAVLRLGRQGHALAVLEDGSGTVEGEPLEGPALRWFALHDGGRLRVEAGATGYVAEVTDDFVTRAVADFSEVPILGFVTERDFSIDLPDDGIVANLAAIRSEIDLPRTGSSMVVAAYFRILLVSMLRLSGLDAQLQGGGSSARFLQRFRELVEGNFRAHWPIARYAELIGVSHDRLHALCTRQLNRTPKALVAERLAREAGLGLERSTLTIEQLSYALGFRDPAHFSHFFKRMTGIAPGAFRRMMMSAAPGSRTASPANFADWP